MSIRRIVVRPLSVSISAVALSSVSRYSSSGSESATMPPPAWKYTCPPKSHERPDDDAGVHRPSGAQVADRAAVDPTAGGLQLGDDLHRPHLWRAGDRAAGEGGPQQIHGIRGRARARPPRWRPDDARWDDAPGRTARERAPCPAGTPGRDRFAAGPRSSRSPPGPSHSPPAPGRARRRASDPARAVGYP